MGSNGVGPDRQKSGYPGHGLQIAMVDSSMESIKIGEATVKNSCACKAQAVVCQKMEFISV